LWSYEFKKQLFCSLDKTVMFLKYFKKNPCIFYL
jgi:hypothetical protein